MKKSEYSEITKKYLKRRSYLQKINLGDLVWDENGWGDYHTAIVKEVNIDEDYIRVIDVTRSNEEFDYEYFLTEEEMLKKGFSKEGIEKERKKYAGLIKKVIENKL